ncbi:hydrolase [Kribbella turkmenica]|uniref:alpha-L-rhamnosidase n=1 Tax=Kribbella turkmenica TaxID=2530375 RepID=A0A4R4WPJ7_9ACTN|nr:family 78 glycoside hydrolase catalytic domain [Kribbella turkmenica]TDD18275.1 hydrolase [Kribbella turkmenica]
MHALPDGWTPGGPLDAGTLRTEYAERPLGTDVRRPRFGWVATAPGYGATQTAYQILIASAPELLTPESADVWDSGKVTSSRTVGVEYDGPPLTARTRYHWTVRLWDGQDLVGPWVAPEWFETALLDEGFAGARWIGGATDGAPLLRRLFAVGGAVKQARLYACGLGYAELRLNGHRVGDAVLDPGFTDYDHTVLYVTHDVTDLLQSGDNVVGAELGRGFFGLTTPNAWRWHQAPWTAEPRLLARLVIEYDDGRTAEVVSDETWQLTGGPTVSNDLYTGETYDARRALPGWDTAAFDDSVWAAASVVDGPRGSLQAQAHEPIRVVETVEPTEVTRVRPGVWIVDFGRTAAGWTTLTVTADAGTAISLTHGETVADGNVVAENVHVEGDRIQRDVYIAAGTGAEEWEPRFSYKGFRYVQVEGTTQRPHVQLRVAHSDVRNVTRFASTQSSYEQFDRAMRRTILNNLHGIPTDTPFMEKNGWTGDAQVGGPTMLATLDLARFFTKWLGDIRDSQAESGQLPVIVPSSGWGFTDLSPATEWPTVYPFLLREMHRAYDDERLLHEHWESLTRYLTWELDRVEEGLSVSVLGDWLPPGYGSGPAPEDRRLTGTAYLYRALIAAAEIGDLIGKPHDYRKAAADLSDGLNRAFLDRESGVYRSGDDPDYRQTSNAVPLAFGMVPEGLVPRVAANLAADVRARGFHLNTGCLGVGVLLPVLTAHGYADVATKVALQRSYPSWLYWFGLGADTMWEKWEEDSRSRNHYFQGTVVQWVYENVAGLRNLDAGWQRILVRPDARDQVSSASIRTDTVRGRVAVTWKRVSRVLSLDVEVPVGTTAEVHVPSAAAADVSAVPAPFAGEAAYVDGYTVYTVPAGLWNFTSRSA